MTLTLAPKKFWSVSHPWLDFWNEEEEWLRPITGENGLSVYEDEKKVYVEAAVPGVEPKDIELTFRDGHLWIRGEAKEVEENKKKKYYRKASQSFSYRVAVPGEVDDSKEPEATYKKGVLTVAFDKSPKKKPVMIKIKTAKGE